MGTMPETGQEAPHHNIHLMPGWAGAHIRYFDFFCRLSVTDARIDLSSLSERAKQVLVLMVLGARETIQLDRSYYAGTRG